MLIGVFPLDTKKRSVSARFNLYSWTIVPTDSFVYGNIKFGNIIFKTYHIEMGPVIIIIMNKIGPVISERVKISDLGVLPTSISKWCILLKIQFSMICLLLDADYRQFS